MKSNTVQPKHKWRLLCHEIIIFFLLHWVILEKVLIWLIIGFICLSGVQLVLLRKETQSQSSNNSYSSLYNLIYHKVASRSTSRLVARPRIFWLLMKGKFDPCVLWPLAWDLWPLNSRPVYCSRLYGNSICAFNCVKS